jgi:hypothetical protein
MTDFCGNSVGTHFCSCKNDACAAPVRSAIWLSVSERARSGARSIELHSLLFVLCCYILLRVLLAAALWMSLMQKGSRIISSGSCEFAIHEKCCCWMHTQPHCISWAWNCLAVFSLKMCPGQWASPKLYRMIHSLDERVISEHDEWAPFAPPAQSAPLYTCAGEEF